MNTRYKCERKDCKYYGLRRGLNTCDYYFLTDVRRGSTIPKCTRYEKGERPKVRRQITLDSEEASCGLL